MAIRTVVTRGYGNGTFSGTIPLVVTRGYSIAEEAPVQPQAIVATTIRSRLIQSTTRSRLVKTTIRSRRVPGENR